MRFKQCELIKGSRCQVAWIPDKFAVEGKYLRLKQDDGWRVNYVGPIAIDDYEITKAMDHDVFESIRG